MHIAIRTFYKQLTCSSWGNTKFKATKLNENKYFAFSCEERKSMNDMLINKKTNLNKIAQFFKILVCKFNKILITCLFLVLTLLNVYGAIVLPSFISMTCFDSIARTSPLSILKQTKNNCHDLLFTMTVPWFYKKMNEWMGTLISQPTG